MTHTDGPPDADATSTDGRRAESVGERTASFVWTDESRAESSDDDVAGDANTETESAATAPEDGLPTATAGAIGPERHAVNPERYLLGGESLVDTFETAAGWVAITTHRLLVFDPTGDGRRFEAIDRLNVVDVRCTGGGDPDRLSRVARTAVYAVVLLLTWAIARSFGLGSLFTTTADATTTPGIGGLVSALSLVGALVSLLVSGLFLAGAVVGAVAVGLGLVYLRGRQPTLVVERAGEDRLTVAVSSSFAGEHVVSAVERALAAELALVDDQD